MRNHWNPTQYSKFAADRNKPFYDLVALVDPQKDMSIVDLGCGTGQLTQYLHQKLHAKKTLGIDSSAEMLKESDLYASPDLQFTQTEIEKFSPKEKYDLIFSNAALQWVRDHKSLFSRLTDMLSERGQIAIQMPYNSDFPTHRIARELSQHPEFKDLLQEGWKPSVLSAEEYAQLLYELKYSQQKVFIQVYPLVLESTEALIEWVKGSLLTYYQARLPKEKYEQFLTLYRERLYSIFGNSSPLFIPFQRLFLWAAK